MQDEPMVASAELTANRALVVDWVADFTRLVSLCERDAMFYTDTLSPKAGSEADVAQLRASMELRTVRVARIVAAHAGGASYKAPGTMQMVPFDPIVEWSGILGSRPRSSPDLVTTLCYRAIGAIDIEFSDAVARETSLAGRIQRRAAGARSVLHAFRGTPREVRDHPSAFWMGMVVGVASGLIVFWITKLAGWL